MKVLINIEYGNNEIGNYSKDFCSDEIKDNISDTLEDIIEAINKSGMKLNIDNSCCLKEKVVEEECSLSGFEVPKVVSMGYTAKLLSNKTIDESKSIVNNIFTSNGYETVFP
ncbi:MAG: hypothetical protein M1365_12635 [Actinobacteria bacterium]|nr:hypothetical protein [Actinomycetota bacterium]